MEGSTGRDGFRGRQELTSGRRVAQVGDKLWARSEGASGDLELAYQI